MGMAVITRRMASHTSKSTGDCFAGCKTTAWKAGIAEEEDDDFGSGGADGSEDEGEDEGGGEEENPEEEGHLPPPPSLSFTIGDNGNDVAAWVR
jgi:hypothetical protein